MRKTIKLTESDLTRIVKRVMNESYGQKSNLYSDINDLISKYSDLDPSDVVEVLEIILKHSKATEYRKKNNIGSLTKDEVLRNFKR
jgi:hypothetical protein